MVFTKHNPLKCRFFGLQVFLGSGFSWTRCFRVWVEGLGPGGRSSLDIVPNFYINTEHNFLNTKNISHNPIENAVYKYENHPNAIAIKIHMKGINSSFSFQTVTKENIAKLITNLIKSLFNL